MVEGAASGVQFVPLLKVPCGTAAQDLLLMGSPGLQIIELCQHVAALTHNLLMRPLLLLILRLNLRCALSRTWVLIIQHLLYCVNQLNQ